MPGFVSQDNRFNCPTCGAENFDFASFCITCGMSLDEAEYEAEPDVISNSKAEVPSHSQFRPVTKRSHGSGFMGPQWEVWAGILMLILVAAYLLYDWQHSNAQTEAYRNGLVATEGKDWDRAVASFERAGDYLTSEQREEAARKKVAERDRLYIEGLKATARRDWRSSIGSLQRLQQVQPAFRDSADLLAQAKSNVLNDGLASIVYLVDDGPSPGLYVRDEQGLSTLLPDSDRHSIVRAISPDGAAIVYDRPSNEIDYLAPSWNHNPMLQDPFGQNRSDRIQVLARLDDVITTLPLPQLDRDGTGIFTDKGLWWYSSQPSSGLFGYEVSYWSQYLPGGADVVRVSDLANGKRVVAVDPPRSRVAITEAKGNARDSDRETYLYLAEATGQDPQLLHVVHGEVYQASFSRDGRWLLYLTQQNGATQITRAVSVLRFDTTALATGEQPSSRILQRLSWSGIEMNTRLSASFIPSQTGSSKVIVNHVEYGTEHLLVHDLDANIMEMLWRDRSDGAYRRDLSAFSHDGEYMASGQRYDGTGITTSIIVANLRPRSQLWNITPFPASNSQIVKTRFAPLDDYVIVSIQNEEGINRGHTQRVYSLMKGDGRSTVEARLIAEADWPYDTDISTIAMPYNGSMLAYVNPQRELHAVFYDGTGDILVSGNVKAVWSLKGRRDLSWWR